MSRETAYAGMIGDLERLLAALLASVAELPQLAGVRLHLEQILALTLATAQEQADLIAGKQDASQRLPRLVGGGERKDTVVRMMLKAHYGLNAERLAELGIRPVRGRSRRTAPWLPPLEEPAPIPEIARPAGTNPL